MNAKNILLFGAGKSASVLIDYLIKESTINNWKITIADANKSLIDQKTGNHPQVISVGLDITHHEFRQSLIASSDIVISMMPPSLHYLIADDCVQQKKSLLTASYADENIKNLHEKVLGNGNIFLCEMGLDPGIDHMSAMEILDSIKLKGGKIISFKSHCGGLVAPESDNNPWRYKISWNPRNVVTAGKLGAIYLDQGEIVNEEYTSLFNNQRKVKIDGDEFCFYPNRNSLSYIDLYNLKSAKTFIRTTLRYSDFMYGWNNLIELGFTDETVQYQTDGMSLQAFFKLHLSKYKFDQWLDKKLSEKFSAANTIIETLIDENGNIKESEFLQQNESITKKIESNMHEANITLNQLLYLGMEDNSTLINLGTCSAADVLQLILEKKLLLQPEDKDMIVMFHEIEYELNNTLHQINSSLIVKGDDNVNTAMAKTVGLPLGIAAKFILNGTIQQKGVLIPVEKEIYTPVLNELKKYGISFKENHF
jgi:saccharopine dehydrogenase-like NADP-dependent oxidoreductase